MLPNTIMQHGKLNLMYQLNLVVNFTFHNLHTLHKFSKPSGLHCSPLNRLDFYVQMVVLGCYSTSDQISSQKPTPTLNERATYTCMYNNTHEVAIAPLHTRSHTYRQILTFCSSLTWGIYIPYLVWPLTPANHRSPAKDWRWPGHKSSPYSLNLCTSQTSTNYSSNKLNKWSNTHSQSSLTNTYIRKHAVFSTCYSACQNLHQSFSTNTIICWTFLQHTNYILLLTSLPSPSLCIPNNNLLLI